MNGVLSFFANGGRSGPPRESRFKRIDKKTQRAYGKGFGGDRDRGPKDQNDPVNEEPYQKGAVIEDSNFNFTEDLKKLVGPQGSGTFLFTQNPRTKAFMAKYGLDDQDIIKLRMGVTQRGFGSKINEVFDKITKTGNLKFSFPGMSFTPQSVTAQFQLGMTPFDRLPSTRGGFMGGIENLFAKGAFSSLADKLAGGSPMGSAGLAMGRDLGLEGNELNKFASVMANNRNLYNEMMTDPFMRERNLNMFVDQTQRGLPTRDGKAEEPTPDPITAAYDPSMNPYLNSGIGNFRFFT
jgi:hypothetical protein